MFGGVSGLSERMAVANQVAGTRGEQADLSACVACKQFRRHIGRQEAQTLDEALAHTCTREDQSTQDPPASAWLRVRMP